MVKTPRTIPRRKKHIPSSDSDDPLDSIPDLAPPVRPAAPDDPLDVIGISSSPSPSPPSFFRTPNRPPPPSVTRKASGMSTGGRWGQRGSGSRDVDRRGSAPVARASGSAKRRRIDAPYREDGELEETVEEIEDKPEYRDGSPRAIKRELLPAGPGKSLLARLGPPVSPLNLYQPYRTNHIYQSEDFDEVPRRAPPTGPRSQRVVSESEEERRPGIRHSLPARPKLEVKEESEPEEEEEIEERTETERGRLPSVGQRDQRAKSSLPPRPRSPHLSNRAPSREPLVGPSRPVPIPSREVDDPDDTSAEWPDVPSTDDEDRLGQPHYLRPAEPLVIDTDTNDSRPDTPPLPDDLSPITFLSRPTVTPPHLATRPATPPVEAKGRSATPPATYSSRPPTPPLPPRQTSEEEEEEEAEESVEEESEAEEEIEEGAAEEDARLPDAVWDKAAAEEPVSAAAAAEAAEDIEAEEDVSMTLLGVAEGDEDDAPPPSKSPEQESGKDIQMEQQATVETSGTAAPIGPGESVAHAAPNGKVDAVEDDLRAEEAGAAGSPSAEVQAAGQEAPSAAANGESVPEETTKRDDGAEADVQAAAADRLDSDDTAQAPDSAPEAPAEEGMDRVEELGAPAGVVQEAEVQAGGSADVAPDEVAVEPIVDIAESGMDGVEEEKAADADKAEVGETVEAGSADPGGDGAKTVVPAVEEADVTSGPVEPSREAKHEAESAKQPDTEQTVTIETPSSNPSTAEPAPSSVGDTTTSVQALPSDAHDPEIPPSQGQLPTPPPSTAPHAPRSPLPQQQDSKEAAPPLSPRVPSNASAPFTIAQENGTEDRDVEMGASASSPVQSAPPAAVEEEGEEELDPADQEMEEDPADHTSTPEAESTSKRGESSDITDINTPTPAEPVTLNKDGSVRKKAGRVAAPRPAGWKSWHKGNYTYENGVAIKKVKEPAGKKGKVEALKSAARGRSGSSPVSDTSDTPLTVTKTAAPVEKSVPAEDVADDTSDDEEVWCSCGRRSRPDGNDMMIGCDGCDNWFHAGCVKLTKEEVDLVDTFFCPACEKSTGKRTTMKLICKRDGCERIFSEKRSKFCSDNCGYRHAQTIVAGMQNKKQLKQLADALANYPSPPPDIRIIDHSSGPTNPSSALNSFFPSLPDPIEVLTKRIEASQNLITILQKRLAILAKASDQCEGLPPLNPQNGDEGGKKKRKTGGGDDRPCGWVGALIWDDVEVGAWEVGMPVGNEVRAEGQGGEEEGEDVEMGRDEVEVGYCLNPRKRCDRHSGWQKIIATSLDMELSQIQEALSGLEAERDYLVSSAEAKQAGKAAQESLHEILAVNLAKKFV